jgi:hypothetical protein
MKSDPLVIEATINALTGSDEKKYTIELRHSASPGSRATGRGMTILLEGHDISHLVTSFTLDSSVDDATRITFEMVGLRPV